MQAGETWISPNGIEKTIKQIDILPNWKHGATICIMTDGTAISKAKMLKEKWKEVKHARK